MERGHMTNYLLDVDQKILDQLLKNVSERDGNSREVR